MMDKCYDDMGPDKKQKDIMLKTSIADTGAQCFLLGSNHLNGLGLDVSRTMVYVIEGNIILVSSKAVLETLGCIPKTFPQVRQQQECPGRLHQEPLQSRSIHHLQKTALAVWS